MAGVSDGDDRAETWISILQVRGETRQTRPDISLSGVWCLVSELGTIDGMLSKPVSALKYHLLECSSASN